MVARRSCTTPQEWLSLYILGSVTVQRDAAGVPAGVVAVNHDITKRKEAEEALRNYAEEVKDLYNNAPCGYHSLNPEGVVVQINDTELRWLGYTREEIIGCLKFTDLLTSAGKRIFAATFPRFQEQGWVKDLEFDLIRRDGSIITVLLSATAMYDEQGRFLASRATIYDITALKQAQQVIRENEKKFRLLVEVAPLAILISDENGKITLVNEQAEQLFGYSRAELVGQSVELLVPQGARALHPQHRAAYLAAPGVRWMAGERELFAVRKDGSEFPVAIQLSSAENQTGSFIMNITERKQAAAALQEQRDFLQLVIDSVPDLILVKDRAGYFHLVNERTAQVYHTSPAAMVGQRDADIHDSVAAVALFRQQDLTTMDSGQPLFIPETIIQQRCYQATLIPLRNSAGQHDRVLMVASDVTERKRAEEALQQAFEREKELSELKSRFVSMASHEFRAPLSTISALTETLSAYRHRLSEDQIVQRLDKIHEQVAYLNDIVEDVLQLARIQAQGAKFEPVPLELNAFCRSIIEEFQSQATVAQRLSYSCDTQLPTLKLDKRLMRQIINNLITNALKYSGPDTQIVVNATCAGEVFVLQVCDEGIGIPKADMKYLFEPFHRAANVGAISGTGLGLAITKEAVEMHGGVISVESQLGIGTTFTVQLPVATKCQSE
ncbi:MAG: PAS domain-containing sensor histidine kinase [Caldilineaceae bacterium]